MDEYAPLPVTGGKRCVVILAPFSRGGSRQEGAPVWQAEADADALIASGRARAASASDCNAAGVPKIPPA